MTRGTIVRRIDRDGARLLGRKKNLESASMVYLTKKTVIGIKIEGRGDLKGLVV